jgi:hypothetical protein
VCTPQRRLAVRKPFQKKTGSRVGVVNRLIIDVTMTADIKVLFNRADAKAASSKAVVTTGVESFVAVCKLMALPFELHNMYRDWLKETVGISDETLVTGREKLKPCLSLPYPTGYRWQELKAEGSRKQRRAYHVDFSPEEDAAWAAEIWLEGLLLAQNSRVAAGGRYCFNIKTSVTEIANEIELLRPATNVLAAKKKRLKAVATGTKPAPANVRSAMDSEEALEWIKSMNNEF